MISDLIKGRVQPTGEQIARSGHLSHFEFIIQSVEHFQSVDGDLMVRGLNEAFVSAVDTAFALRKHPHFRLVNITVIERLTDSASATTRRYVATKNGMMRVEKGIPNDE